MKKIILLLLTVFLAARTFAQESKYDIAIAAYIPDQLEIPVAAKNQLTNKLKSLVTNNGITSGYGSDQFIITTNIAVVSKDVIGSAPTKVALNLDVTFYIGDGISGELFSTATLSVKGVGINETKAYLSAVKRISPNSPALNAFVVKGKEKIMDYYNSNCDNVIKMAEALAKQNQPERALSLLTGVPASSSFYAKSEKAIQKIYDEAINNDCKKKLAEANAIWNANQDKAAAQDVATILSSIDPNAKCFGDAKSLYNKVEERVRNLDDREWGKKWDYKFEQLEVEKQKLSNTKDLAMAYLSNRPNYTFVYDRYAVIKGWYY